MTEKKLDLDELDRLQRGCTGLKIKLRGMVTEDSGTDVEFFVALFDQVPALIAAARRAEVAEARCAKLEAEAVVYRECAAAGFSAITRDYDPESMLGLVHAVQAVINMQARNNAAPAEPSDEGCYSCNPNSGPPCLAMVDDDCACVCHNVPMKHSFIARHGPSPVEPVYNPKCETCGGKGKYHVSYEGGDQHDYVDCPACAVLR